LNPRQNLGLIHWQRKTSFMTDQKFIIIGAGIMGLSIARELQQNGYRNISIIEKENGVGKHCSGRNSGILHSGIYYPEDTLKAKFCVRGNQLMREYADSESIQYQRTGKIIVCADESQLPTLDMLKVRGEGNQVRVQKIDQYELKQLEPHAKTHEFALFCEDTTVINPHDVLSALQSEVSRNGAQFFFGEEVVRVEANINVLQTGKSKHTYDFLINCSGLQADRIAHLFGVGLNFHIMPFKGMYKKLRKEAAELFGRSIYPVPDLRYPFLGVHITKNHNGDVYVGPTAIPVFGRENYSALKGIEVSDFASISSSLVRMYFKNENNFRNYVHAEFHKYSDQGFLNSLSLLADSIHKEDIVDSNKVGIRPQLVEKSSMKLLTDFVVERTDNTLHILNAISPAFTCSFSFSAWIAENLFKQSYKPAE
jgi:(S)-2-hydroxyglutarate dehydrogenase